MSENRTKNKRKSKRGRPPRHGGYSLIARDEILKDNPRIRQYLQDTRDGLVRDIAGTEDRLTEQQRILIDRIITRLSICRLIEVYIEKYGLFRKDKLKKYKVLELEPALGQNYLSFSNSIDRTLRDLGIDKKESDEALDIKEYVEKTYGKKEKGSGEPNSN